MPTKDHPLYEEFKKFQENYLWNIFRGNRIKMRFNVMVADIDRFDDITSEITMTLKTFANFRMWSDGDFDLETDRHALFSGNYGRLWTAKIMVSKDAEPDVLKFTSDLGREIKVSADIFDIEKKDWKDSIVRNYDATTGEINNENHKPKGDK